jgi:hypothetical protein
MAVVISEPLRELVGGGENAKYIKECTEMFLSGKGIEKIRGFEPFVNLESLWLNGNKLKKLNNLDNQKRLKAIYAHVSCRPWRSSMPSSAAMRAARWKGEFGFPWRVQAPQPRLGRAASLRVTQMQLRILRNPHPIPSHPTPPPVSPQCHRTTRFAR